MRIKRTALVSLLATLLVAGCASGPHGMRMGGWWPWARTHTTCNGPTCHLKVTVTSTGAKSCKSHIDFEELEITAKGPVKIIWTIPGPGSFVDRPGSGDGVDRKGNSQFQGRDHGAQQFKYDFTNTTSGRHKYDINTELRGVRCETYDPFVMN